MEHVEVNPRQTRALVLLAGHGAVLVFAFGYYARLIESVTTPPMLHPLVGAFFIIPAVLPAIGVGVSYSALVASTDDNEKNWRTLERISMGLFAWIVGASIFAIYLAFTTLDPLLAAHR